MTPYEFIIHHNLGRPTSKNGDNFCVYYSRDQWATLIRVGDFWGIYWRYEKKTWFFNNDMKNISKDYAINSHMLRKKLNTIYRGEEL